MTDVSPSTPFSSRSSAGPTPGSSGPTPRHLKRLSLSTASALSPSSPASPLSNASASPHPRAGSATPASPADRRANHGVRSLRLSLSGSLPPSPLADPSPSSTPLTHGQSSGDATSTSPTLSRRSSLRASTAPGTPPLDSGPPSASARRSGHARRTSSISYARSSLDGGSAANGLGLTGGFDEPLASASGMASPARRRSLDGGGPGTPLGGVREEPEREDGATEEGGEDGLSSASMSRPPSLGMPGAPAQSVHQATQATLVEQNADLLSFIAKKERKCLDLREELKRHEGELAALKKKWESIVARSLQQQQQQASSHPRNLSISTVSSASPNTSPTPRQSAVLHPAHTAHSLDLSLLSSTFDATDLDGSGVGPETPIEIPESVKAAGTWLGNQLGRVLDATVGLPSPSEERPNALESLKEVEEEDEEDGDEARSRRRESKGSSVETDASSTASFPGASARSTAPSSVAGSEDTVSPLQPGASTFDTPAKPSSASVRRQQLFTPPPSASSAHSHHTPSASSSSPFTPPSAGLTHSRSRSTALSTLSGGWTSLNRKLSALSESETFKNSKRATLGLVDTFEQGLASALGPLEPPALDALAVEPVSPTRRSRPHPQRRASDIPSPFLAASGSPPAAPSASASAGIADASLPGATLVPGQGLGSVFSSWARSSAPASSGSSFAPPPSQQQQAPSQGQPQGQGWDWSAFLPGSASSEGLDAQAAPSPVKGGERRRSSGAGARPAVRAVKEAAPADEGDEWPAW
ncbi:hypothetical protein JCM10207_001310 [Rhodosporidiobolus poonsookiae]